MLSRRHLRIKVLQALYGSLKDESESIGAGERALFKSVDSIYELFIYQLSFLVELRIFGEKLIQERKQKRLPTKEDLNPNTTFIENPVLIALENNSNFKKKVSEFKINWTEDIDTIRKMYHQIHEAPFFVEYMNGKNEFVDHKNILVKIFKGFIADSETMQFIFEEKSIHWVDDHYFVCGYVVKYLKGLNSNFSDKSPLPELYKDLEDDIEFVKNLYRFTLVEEQSLEKIIMKKAKNWESDRIATVDMLLMKMAVCELMKMTSIPVKVTLNEYIDISKSYSTPKSKIFINGVLDKIVPELKKDNLLNKKGRGLIG
jgi:N utilization substance protein B